ncbi:MAG TPA: hypothetical protein VN947_13480 [Polyangia bacterium]|nr:hypothetical protein [Polyangia bacterium]
MKLGALMLSLWSGINLVLAVGILAAMTLGGRHAPALALYVGDAQLRALDPRVVGVVDALAIFGNGCAAAFCALMLFLVWRGITQRLSLAWPVVAVVACWLQAIGFASDTHIANIDLAVNLGSTALLGAGLALTWLAGRRLEAQSS